MIFEFVSTQGFESIFAQGTVWEANAYRHWLLSQGQEFNVRSAAPIEGFSPQHLHDILAAIELINTPL